MRAPSWLIPIAMMVGITACSAPVAHEFGKEDIAGINQLIEDFTAAYNAKDAVKVSKLFTGAAVVMPPNASTVRGEENVRVYYVNRFVQGASDLVLDPRDIAGSGTLAHTSGDYRLNMAPSGGPVRRDRGKFLFVLRNFNGKWLLEYLMFSSDFAAVPPPAS